MLQNRDTKLATFLRSEFQSDVACITVHSTKCCVKQCFVVAVEERALSSTYGNIISICATMGSLDGQPSRHDNACLNGKK